MFSMIMDSMKLFITGRLFANYGQVFSRGIFASLLGAAVTAGLGLLVTSWLWAAVVGGAVAGFILPILLKNLKYR